MHVPDGFLDAPTSLVTGAVAAGTIAVCLRGARRELDEKTAPLAGLVAAFVFAVQMINFPVGAGTSGHLMGGALAAVLVGPYTGILCVAVVAIVQALLFADGGLTALGSNIVLISIVPAIVGYAVIVVLLRLLPKRPASVLPAAMAGAFVSVPVTAMVFVGLFAVGGGGTDVPLAEVAAAMFGVHVLIGIGEAVITGLTVASILAVRPDLIYAIRHYRQDLPLRDAPMTTVEQR
ncbi:hypothetical protein BH20ACT5_BH20ACT5_23420 [soil metagenome]